MKIVAKTDQGKIRKDNHLTQEQLSAALAEVKELRKINASLNRQLNEMLEDGQLTL